MRGELWKDTDALGKVWTRAYDENGNLTSLTDPLSKVISWTYNDSDLVETETRYSATLNIVTSYTYDENLNLETITVYNPDTEANDAVYEYAYDEDDNPTSLTYPNAKHVEAWTWGTAKELLTHTDCNGKVTTYTYTGRRRLSQISHGSPYTEYVDFTYRGVTTLPETVNKYGGEDIIEYGYDELLRLETVEWTVGSSAYKTISYEYDDAGNRTLMTDPEGIDYEYTYDDNERLYQVKRDGTTQATYTYDEGGRIEQVLYANGSKRLYEYSDRSEVTKITIKNSSNATLASFEYDYNDRGEIVELVRGHLSETVTFDYDDDGRLIEESSTGGSGAGITVPSRSLAWEYDKAGNRTEQTADSVTTTYAYDEESRLLSHTTSSVTTDYTYDGNGSVLTRTVGDIEETFSYDYLDRAASYVKVDKNGPTTLEEWAYAHMPTGQRVFSQDLDADETTWFMHDGHDVVTDYHQEGTGKLYLTVSYINALGLDDRLGRVTASGGATHFYVGDLVGTTAHLLTSSQTLVNSEVRDAWGNSVASSLSVTDRYDFAGRESDPESGLTYMRHRLYDPRTGRFGQKDPIVGNRPTQHYLYGFNQPTGFTDPMGLESFWAKLKRGWDRTVDFLFGNQESCLMKLRQWGATKSPWIAATTGFISELGLTPIRWSKSLMKNPIGPIQAIFKRWGQVADTYQSGGSSAATAHAGALADAILSLTGANALYEAFTGHDLQLMLDTGEMDPTLSGWERAERGVAGATQLFGSAAAAPGLFRSAASLAKSGATKVGGFFDAHPGMNPGNYRPATATGSLPLGPLGEGAVYRGPAAMRPYGGPGGGHHVPAQLAFDGAPGYDPTKALAIPNGEMARLGIRHPVVTGGQASGYRALAASGQPITWENMAQVEINALIRAGMPSEMAKATVARAIEALKQAGVRGPTRIPWGH